MKPHRTTFAALMLGLVAATVASTVAVAAPPGVPRIASIDGNIARIVDGDTIDINVGLLVYVQGRSLAARNIEEIAAQGFVTWTVRIRLLADNSGRGCWAPESRTKIAAEKKRGLAAKAHLAKLAPLGKPCRIEVVVDSYEVIDYLSMERILAVVRIGNTSLGEAQILAKHASSTKTGVLGK